MVEGLSPSISSAFDELLKIGQPNLVESLPAEKALEAALIVLADRADRRLLERSLAAGADDARVGAVEPGAVLPAAVDHAAKSSSNLGACDARMRPARTAPSASARHAFAAARVGKAELAAPRAGRRPRPDKTGCRPCSCACRSRQPRLPPPSTELATRASRSHRSSLVTGTRRIHPTRTSRIDGWHIPSCGRPSVRCCEVRGESGGRSGGCAGAGRAIFRDRDSRTACRDRKPREVSCTDTSHRTLGLARARPGGRPGDGGSSRKSRPMGQKWASEYGETAVRSGSRRSRSGSGAPNLAPGSYRP